MCVPYTTLLYLPIDNIAAALTLEDQILPIRLLPDWRRSRRRGPAFGRAGFATSPAMRLFSRELRLALFLERPDALLGIRRP
ncbi:MAG: hypothetical protein QOJ15_4323 [Bradyrhizobium sp.]|nr:hypothetical protein [Bradyrhizobium sp.]